MFAALYVDACHVSNLANNSHEFNHENVRSRANQEQSHDVLLRILRPAPKLDWVLVLEYVLSRNRMHKKTV